MAGWIKDFWRGAGAGQFIGFIGGAITKVAATGMVVGAFMALFGIAPGQFFYYLFEQPPEWLMSGWTRLLVLILGLVTIGFFLRFNVWSLQQKAIDALAEELSWAIHHLLNSPLPTDLGQMNAYVESFEAGYREWCNRVSKKLESRAFFTRADQLHFDRLGFIEPVVMIGHEKGDWLRSQLRLKFERLRDVINWVQLRRR